MILFKKITMTTFSNNKKNAYYANLIGFMEGCKSLNDSIWWCDSLNDELEKPVNESYYQNYVNAEDDFVKVVRKIHSIAKENDKFAKFNTSFFNPYTQKTIEFYVCNSANNKNYKFYFLDWKSLNYLQREQILNSQIIAEYKVAEEKLIEAFVDYHIAVQKLLKN